MIQLQALLVPIIPDNEFWEASSQDGKAARALGQSSTMGAVLDMVSDRYILLLQWDVACSISLTSVVA